MIVIAVNLGSHKVGHIRVLKLQYITVYVFRSLFGGLQIKETQYTDELMKLMRVTRSCTNR